MKREIVETKPAKGELYLGIEIEAMLKGKSVEIELGRIAQVYGNDCSIIYGKHDGSISENVEAWMPEVQCVELVCQPMTLDCYRNRKWTVVFDRYVKPKKYETSTLGGHIHLTKAAFTLTQLYKFCKFIRTNVEYVTYIGERKLNNSYCSSYCSTGKVVRQIKKGYENNNRYEMLNITYFNTVELRFFGSPYDRTSMIKNLEWCWALWEYTKIAPLHFTYKDFNKWIKENKQHFEILASWIDYSKTFKTNEENTISRDRYDTSECYHCNRERDAEDMYYISSEDNYICEHCVNTCSCCDEHFLRFDTNNDWCPNCQPTDED